MPVSGHKSTDSLKIYQKVSGNEEFMMGYILGYALMSPKEIPIGPLQRHILPVTPKQKAILPKPTQDEDPIPKRSKVNEMPTTAPLTQPTEAPENIKNIVAILDEFDFHLAKIISDTYLEMHQIEERATQLTRSNAMVPVTENQNITSTSTNNTQINIANAQRKIPGFYNCSFGTVNFNFYSSPN